MILELHHIQLAMPEGEEQAARNFYCGVLGLCEVDKPEELRSRGGAWFESGSVKVHLGVEKPFAPAKKAHPAFRVEKLDQTIAALQSRSIGFWFDADLPGIRRIYVSDPFGNRIELLELV
ncbi:glyoxalase [Mesorhizobium sp. B2-9-1]|uniref:VOC family protein n=1 Tax=unclassified Mesorhizobium TaxID=325217 RepID=UPI00112E3C73|nr:MULTISPECIES: VOC family protein [unclassified Mesorhizobium]TPI48693.1 glyoxalase [Mesorhizobium sp. B2-9-1]TPJ30973.1 glyoxalase [Mesorhizobium sp. B2-7-2]